MALPPNSCTIDATLLANAVKLLQGERDIFVPFPGYPEESLERLLQAIILFDKTYLVSWTPRRYTSAALVRQLRQFGLQKLNDEYILNALPMSQEERYWIKNEIRALGDFELVPLLKKSLHFMQEPINVRSRRQRALVRSYLSTFAMSDWWLRDPEGGKPGGHLVRGLHAVLREELKSGLRDYLQTHSLHENEKMLYALEFLCRGIAYQRWSSSLQSPYLCHPARTSLVNLDTGSMFVPPDARDAIQFAGGFRSKVIEQKLKGIAV